MAQPDLLPSLLRERAADADEQLALIALGHEPLTYSEWHLRSNVIANALLDAGVVHGQRIGLVFQEQDWDDYACAYMGVLKCGACAVPLSAAYGAGRLQRIFTDLSVAYVVTGVPGLTVAPITTVELSQLIRVPNSDEVFSSAQPGDLAEILFTSGSTGEPKAVCVDHGGTVDSASATHTIAQHSDSYVYSVHSSTIGTSAGQKNLMRAVTNRGACMVFLPYFDPHLFHTAVRRHEAAYAALVPAMVLSLHRSRAGKNGFPSVRNLALSSTTVTQHVVEIASQLFPNARILEFYGSTESGHARLFRRRSLGAADPFHTLAPTQVRIVDKNGDPVRSGQVGYIELWHPSSQRYYDEDRSASDSVFRDGWTRTADLGRSNADGGVDLLGRADDTISVGGINVSPTAVEEGLLEHPCVLEAAVVGIEHDVLGQSIAAAVVLRPGADVTEQALISHSLRTLGRVHAPRQIALVSELPKLPSLKVNRAAVVALINCRDRPSDQFAQSQSAQDNDNDLQLARSQLLKIVRTLLGQPALQADDDLFQAGLDSLMAIELVTDLATKTGTTLDPWLLFESRTVNELYDHIHGQPAADCQDGAGQHQLTVIDASTPAP